MGFLGFGGLGVLGFTEGLVGFLWAWGFRAFGFTEGLLAFIFQGAWGF